MSTLQELAERTLQAAAGDDGCVAIADDLSSGHLRWAGGAVTSSGAARSRRLTVVAFRGAAAGVASRAGALDVDAIRDLADAARRGARRAAAGDAQPLVAGAADPGWFEPPEQISTGAVARVREGLRAAVDEAKAHRCGLYGYAEEQVRTTYVASSTGLRRRHAQPTGLVDLTAARSDGSASTWTGVGAARIEGIDLPALARRLQPRLRWAGRAVAPPWHDCDVLLSPSCVADLMLRLYHAAGARAALDGEAVFGRSGGGTRLGERLSPAPLTLRSDPFEAGLECAPFAIARASDDRVSVFDNGLELAPVRWLSGGVLSALVHTRASARRAGHVCSAEIDNLVLDGAPGGRGLDDMIAGSDRTLLVTSLWYVRDVDPRRLLLTGLTRDGVYLVERGEVTGAVPDFRFNESPVELLGRVTEVGRTEPALPREWGDYFTRIAMPALRVEGFGVRPARA